MRHGWIGVYHQWMESLEEARGAEQGHRNEQKLHHFLGATEVAGGLGVVLDVLTQFAPSGLILVMLGAIQKRISSGAQARGANQEQMGGARQDAGGNESRDPHHRWRKPFSVEMIFCLKTRTTSSQLVCRCGPEISRLCLPRMNPLSFIKRRGH